MSFEIFTSFDFILLYLLFFHRIKPPKLTYVCETFLIIMIIGLISDEWLSQYGIKGPKLVKIYDESSLEVKMLEEGRETVQVDEDELDNLKNSDDFEELIRDKEKASRVDNFEDLTDELDEVSIREKI